jgi:hypothetical protein
MSFQSCIDMAEPVPVAEAVGRRSRRSRPYLATLGQSEARKRRMSSYSLEYRGPEEQKRQTYPRYKEEPKACCAIQLNVLIPRPLYRLSGVGERNGEVASAAGQNFKSKCEDAKGGTV